MQQPSWVSPFTGELSGIVDLLVSPGDGLTQASVAAESDVE